MSHVTAESAELQLSRRIQWLVELLVVGGSNFDSHIGVSGYIGDVVDCFSEIHSLATVDDIDCVAYYAARDSIAIMLGCRKLRPALKLWLSQNRQRWPEKDFEEEIERIIKFA